ncbi:MAG TPA: hypothetical protein VHD87_12180 [Acidimicrobiales bacterium]|nr:hypothetical protein [Acidimicrobiales bacterium]
MNRPSKPPNHPHKGARKDDTGAVGIEITTAHDSADEIRTADSLRQLLDRFDASRWGITHRVVIDENAIPHSHPVLTLSTRVRGRSLTGLLATYLHEQLHWYFDEDTDENAVAAIDACRRLYPSVPDEAGGGARDEWSTYLHLIVCWLEIASLRLVAPGPDTEALVAASPDWPVYPWIYRQCIERYDEIGAIVAAHGFDGILRGAQS